MPTNRYRFLCTRCGWHTVVIRSPGNDAPPEHCGHPNCPGIVEVVRGISDTELSELLAAHGFREIKYKGRRKWISEFEIEVETSYQAITITHRLLRRRWPFNRSVGVSRAEVEAAIGEYRSMVMIGRIMVQSTGRTAA